MSLRISAVLAVGGAALIAAAGAASLSAQPATQRMAQPQLPSGPQLANPTTLPQDVQRCPGYKVYVTLRGVALMCYERRGDSGRGYVMAIRNTNFPGAGEAAVTLLMEQHADAQAYFTNPNAKGSSLIVKHRGPSQEVRGICAMTTAPTNVMPCREVVSLGY